MIWTVILAAGGSSRMGRPKALLPVAQGARTFVAAIAETARAGGSSGVVVVVGPPHDAEIRRRLPAGAASVPNPRPERGMLSSVQAGVSALPEGASAALIWPVDVPFVQPETVRAILDAAPGRLLVPTHDGRGGHPLRVPRARFGELIALDPEAGLKALLEARPAELVRLAVDDPGVLVDIDTPEDLARPAGGAHYKR
jgi:molybdenum cofactor cytidylyltransferase